MTTDNVLPADPAGLTLNVEDDAAERLIDADATEAGWHDGPLSKWRIGLLVARCCEPRQGERTDLHTFEDSSKVEGKATFVDFAHRTRGKMTDKTVSNYWYRWEEHAGNGVVPHAAELRPGDEPPLPNDVKWKPPDPLGDEWYTPKWLFDALGLVYAIDVCSPVDRTHVSVPAESWYTEEDDGLAQDWAGLCWCNPPYSDAEPWADRMIEHGDGMLLTHVPMNGEWMLDVWRACDAFRLFQGMEFVRPDGTLQRPAWWLCLAAFGPQAESALLQMEAPPDIEYRRQPTHLLPGGRR